MTIRKPSNEIERLIWAFGNSVNGLKYAMTESAFRLEAILSAVMIPLAFFVTADTVERILLIGSLFLVMIVELLNTGVERAVDRISSEWHELSKKAKDVGSSAVLLSLINAGFVWFLILFC